MGHFDYIHEPLVEGHTKTASAKFDSRLDRDIYIIKEAAVGVGDFSVSLRACDYLERISDNPPEGIDAGEVFDKVASAALEADVCVLLDGLCKEAGEPLHGYVKREIAGIALELTKEASKLKGVAALGEALGGIAKSHRGAVRAARRAVEKTRKTIADLAAKPGVAATDPRLVGMRNTLHRREQRLQKLLGSKQVSTAEAPKGFGAKQSPRRDHPPGTKSPMKEDPATVQRAADNLAEQWGKTTSKRKPKPAPAPKQQPTPPQPQPQKQPTPGQAEGMPRWQKHLGIGAGVVGGARLLQGRDLLSGGTGSGGRRGPVVVA